MRRGTGESSRRNKNVNARGTSRASAYCFLVIVSLVSCVVCDIHAENVVFLRQSLK